MDVPTIRKTGSTERRVAHVRNGGFIPRRAAPDLELYFEITHAIAPCIPQAGPRAIVSVKLGFWRRLVHEMVHTPISLRKVLTDLKTSFADRASGREKAFRNASLMLLAWRRVYIDPQLKVYLHGPVATDLPAGLSFWI